MTPGAVLVRDTKDQHGPALRLSAATWRAFADRTRNNQLTTRTTRASRCAWMGCEAFTHTGVENTAIVVSRAVVTGAGWGPNRQVYGRRLNPGALEAWDLRFLLHPGFDLDLDLDVEYFSSQCFYLAGCVV